MNKLSPESIPSVPWAAPILRWAGSKRKLLGTLISHAPDSFVRYVEPFAGSACLFFALRPRAAILGDINRELIEMYDVVRSHPRNVSRCIGKWGNSCREYYRVRALSPSELDLVERAARFIYLNRHCFNGVYRTNRLGEFNVPRGTRTGSVPSEALLYRCSIALRNAQLRPDDFEACLHDLRAGDFVYLDPPYAQSKRPTYGEYGYQCFNASDIERLVASLDRIHKKKAVFLLSYADTPAVRERFSKTWYYRTIDVRRHVAGFARHRTRVSELLVSNRGF